MLSFEMIESIIYTVITNDRRSQERLLLTEIVKEQNRELQK